MTDIKILGTGCAKCQKLLEQTKQVVADIRVEATVEKVTDINEIIKYGILMTPALVINGQVRVAGRLPSSDELIRLIQGGV